MDEPDIGCNVVFNAGDVLPNWLYEVRGGDAQFSERIMVTRLAGDNPKFRLTRFGRARRDLPFLRATPHEIGGDVAIRGNCIDPKVEVALRVVSRP